MKAAAAQIAFRYRPQDSPTGVTRTTTKRLADVLGVDETQVIRLLFAANGCIEELRKPPTRLAVYQRPMVDPIENCGRQFKSAIHT